MASQQNRVKRLPAISAAWPSPTPVGRGILHISPDLGSTNVPSPIGLQERGSNGYWTTTQRHCPICSMSTRGTYIPPTHNRRKRISTPALWRQGFVQTFFAQTAI